MSSGADEDIQGRKNDASSHPSRQLCACILNSLGPTLVLDQDFQTTLCPESPTIIYLYECMSNNSTITKVKVNECLVRKLSESELGDLVEHLGRLQALEHLEIASWERELARRKKVPASALAAFFRSAQKVKTVVLWPFLYLSSEADLELLNESLRNHATLESFHLFNILTPRDDHLEHAPVSIGSLLESIATVPNLVHLQLAPGFLLRAPKGILAGHESATCLMHLVRNAPKLESLALRNTGLTDHHVIQLALSLVDETGNKLLNLDLRFNPGITEIGYRALADAMADESHLCLLQHVDLDWNNTGGCMKLQLQIIFYQRLNQMGRYTFLKSPTASWMDRFNVLIESSAEDDLNFTFYLLQHNPSIICQACV